MPLIKQLLAAAQLPTTDLDQANPLFNVAKMEGVIVGCIGFQALGNSIYLLRSFAVTETHQGHGIGGHLLQHTMREASFSKVRDIFLLTTTAKSFFEARGFRIVVRETLPDEVRRCSEFTCLCPSTAVCMKWVHS